SRAARGTAKRTTCASSTWPTARPARSSTSCRWRIGWASCPTTPIAKYSKDHNCIRRLKQAKARIQAQADQKLVELRATAVALSKDDELRIIDTYLAGFEKALAEGRVRFDNP